MDYGYILELESQLECTNYGYILQFLEMEKKK